MFCDTRISYTVPIRQVVNFIVLPVQYAVDWPIAFFDWVHGNLSSRQGLIQENTYLRAEQLMLQARMQKLLALEKENKQLRDLLQSLPKGHEKVLVAQLLAVRSEPFVKQIVLDKGFKQEVFVGQPVIDASGLIGQVIAVAPFSSRVLLITDSQSAVPVQDNRSGERGILIGSGALDSLTLINMAKTTQIQADDQLVTSGLGQRFPEGFPVGTVSQIKFLPGDQFAMIQVKPSANLYKSRLVLLIWPEKRETKHESLL